MRTFPSCFFYCYPIYHTLNYRYQWHIIYGHKYVIITFYYYFHSDTNSTTCCLQSVKYISNLQTTCTRAPLSLKAVSSIFITEFSRKIWVFLLSYFRNTLHGLAHALSHRIFTTEAGVHSQNNLCGIAGGQNGNEAGLYLKTLVFARWLSFHECQATYYNLTAWFNTAGSRNDVLSHS
jgi:hypothetical protein